VGRGVASQAAGQGDIDKSGKCTAIEYTTDRRVHMSEAISRAPTDFGPLVRVENTSGSN